MADPQGNVIAVVGATGAQGGGAPTEATALATGVLVEERAGLSRRAARARIAGGRARRATVTAPERQDHQKGQRDDDQRDRR